MCAKKISKTLKDSSKELIALLNEVAYSHSPENVFRDWARLIALTLANSVPFHDATWQKNEEEYLALAKNYTREELNKFAKMMALLVLLFETEPFQDHLGNIYMEMFGGNKALGQCFTPMSIARVLGDVTMHGATKEDIEKMDKPVTINDCCCGGGACLLGALDYLHSKGIPYQSDFVIYAEDLDPLCCNMCFIQLTLCGCRAVVTQQDSLSGKVYKRMVTPLERLYPVYPFFMSETLGKSQESAAE